MTPNDIARLAKTNSKKAREASWRRRQEMLQPELDRQLHTALGLNPPDYGEVMKALDAGAKADSRVDGWSPMDTATYQRDHGAKAERPVYERIIELLVARGATPEKSMEERTKELLTAIDEADYGGVSSILGSRMDPDTVVDGWTALGRVNHLIEMEESRSLGERRPVRQDALLDIRDILETDHNAKKDLRGQSVEAAPAKSAHPGSGPGMEVSFEDACDMHAAVTLKSAKELHRLIRMEQPDITKIEAQVCSHIKGGGSLDRVVNGWTALGISEGRNLADVSRLLRLYGATKNLQLSRRQEMANAEELAKAIWAATSDDMALTMAKPILEKGLSPYASVGDGGLNALTLANHRGFHSLARLLKEYALERLRQGG